MTDSPDPDQENGRDEYADEMIRAFTEAATIIDEHNEWASERIGPNGKLRRRAIAPTAHLLFKARVLGGGLPDSPENDPSFL